MYNRLIAHILCRTPRLFQLPLRHTAVTTQNRFFATPKKPAARSDAAAALDNAPPDVRRLLAAEADTILYSSYVDSLTPGWLESARQLRRQRRDREAAQRSAAAVRPFSAALQFMQHDDPEQHTATATQTTTTTVVPQLERLMEDTGYDESKSSAQASSPSAWMHDYESYKEPDGNEDDNDDGATSTTGVYGTPDPTQPVSKVPCHGCGAQLQCAEPSLPGYLPSEIFVSQKADYLKVL